MWQNRAAALVILVLVTSSRCLGMSSQLSKIEEKMKEMERTISLLTSQLMMQQLAQEEQVRSDGSSGVKQLRVNTIGTRDYHAESHTGMRFGAIHNHANHIRTGGLGEMIAVLNGIQFTTRHNDFELKMSVSNSLEFKGTEDIPFPGVPPEVMSKPSLTEQIEELREWFKAWKNSDHTKRDYRNYFKPNLCYLEGFWTTPDSSAKIDEPFDSQRHFIDASSWLDLLQKIRFTGYSGRKNALENYAFLPTKIVEVVNGTPVYAQWNYRINCHPVSHDLPLSVFRLVDDLSSRASFGDKGNTREEQMQHRAARFQINPHGESIKKWCEERLPDLEFMDHLMAEIPGLDNYGAELEDHAFGNVAVNVSEPYSKKPKPKNVANYHRFYKEFQRGAMGVQRRKRGFSDENVFMAMTTQKQVPESTLRLCADDDPKNCTDYKQRWSYAIPLEIIYTTPLQEWNPYNLTHNGPGGQGIVIAKNPLPVGENTEPIDRLSRDDEFAIAAAATGLTIEEVAVLTPEELAAVITGGGRGGYKAYNGTSSNAYYRTPEQFFSGAEITEGDAADTTEGVVGVYDQTGTVRKMRASGLRILLPHIPEVGTIRQRWPVAPVHGEGSPVWKELNALKDIVLAPKQHPNMFYDDDGGNCEVVHWG